MTTPFTVLLSVYSKENPSFLDQALYSIWDAQCLKPSQITLVKDGPLTAELDVVIDAWQDRLGVKIFTVLALEENVGLGAALNAGLGVCRYDLVARMDTDDIALPERFEKQISLMQTRSHLSVSSAALEEWTEDLKSLIGVKRLPLSGLNLVNFSKRRSPINHPAAVFRKQHVIEAGGYPDMYPEDYALWVKMLHRGCVFENLPDVVLKMRTGDGFYSRRGKEFLKGEIKIIKLQRRLGMITQVEFFSNVLIRTCLRLSPSFIKRLAYKFAR